MQGHDSTALQYRERAAHRAGCLGASRGAGGPPGRLGLGCRRRHAAMVAGGLRDLQCEARLRADAGAGPALHRARVPREHRRHAQGLPAWRQPIRHRGADRHGQRPFAVGAVHLRSRVGCPWPCAPPPGSIAGHLREQGRAAGDRPLERRARGARAPAHRAAGGGQPRTRSVLLLHRPRPARPAELHRRLQQRPAGERGRCAGRAIATLPAAHPGRCAADERAHRRAAVAGQPFAC